MPNNEPRNFTLLINVYDYKEKKENDLKVEVKVRSELEARNIYYRVFNQENTLLMEVS